METQKEEELKNQIEVSFFIELYEVEGKKGILAKINANGEKIEYTNKYPDVPMDAILRDLKTLDIAYGITSNRKLKEGAREEILKTISTLIWRMYFSG